MSVVTSTGTNTQDIKWRRIVSCLENTINYYKKTVSATDCTLNPLLPNATLSVRFVTHITDVAHVQVPKEKNSKLVTAHRRPLRWNVSRLLYCSRLPERKIATVFDTVTGVTQPTWTVTGRKTRQRYKWTTNIEVREWTDNGMNEKQHKKEKAPRNTHASTHYITLYCITIRYITLHKYLYALYKSANV
jgi:hypothetical protein